MLETNSVDLLVPEFRDRLFALRHQCLMQGLRLGIGTTLRDPETQAKMWCRSRTPAYIANQRAILMRSAPNMASLLMDRDSGLGPPLTEHLPGDSWHQWGEAADVYVDARDIAVWAGSPVRELAKVAKSVGLYHSYTEKGWKPKSRHWHVQLRKEETPLMVRGFCDSWADVEREMLVRFPATVAASVQTASSQP